MKPLFYVVLFLCVLGGTFTRVRAQEGVPPPAPAYEPLSSDQLDQLLGPIALYPDPLIAQILPAATLPEQIVLADRYVSGGGDPGAIGAQPWDPNVQALAYYPSVLQWMDQNLDWTTELGQAFLYQQQDVMDSIQRLRQSAYNFGNLQSTPQEQVINDNGYIEIVPVDPQMIYVPEYQPDQVFYMAASGLPFITFGAAFAIGPWLHCDFDWRNHNLIVWNRDHPRPANWWHEQGGARDMGHTTVWHPDHRPSTVVVNRGDRGWGEPGRVVTPATHRIPVPQAHNVTPVIHAIEPSHPTARPAPVQHVESVSRPEPNGAFIGIQSSHDTKTFSDRGQQSIQAVTHSAPISRPAPSAPVSRPAPSSGGGGGGHGPRH